MGQSMPFAHPVRPALLRSVALAGLLGLMAGAANAADLPLPVPPLPPPPVDFAGGWYLRGDIGFTNQRVDRLQNSAFDAQFPTDRVEVLQKEFDPAPLFGLGVGYRFNNWLRVDVTGEYRARSKFSGLDRVDYGPTPDGVADQTNEFSASKTEIVGLANLYVDLGTWSGITPFIGAGIGFANVDIDNFRDVNVPNNGVAFSASRSRTNFAWALMAGLAYQATDSLTLELGYRYIDLGDGETGDSQTYTGINNFPDKWKFKDLTSHDLKFGMRWALGGETYYQPRGPIVTKY